MTRSVLALAALLSLGSGLAFGQGGWFNEFDVLRSRVRPAENVPYDGRFAFVRLTYDTAPGGFWYRGQPAWSHGYPIAEYNLMQILDALSAVSLHADRTNALSLEDPLLVEPRHRRHHRGVGDVPLLLEDGEHVTDGEGRELLAPHHVHDGGLEVVKTEFEALLPWSKAERHGWLLRWLVIY